MRLKRVLIVEDEKLVLDDLLYLFDWQREGYQVIATAINGKLGLRQFRALRPEIVITDIRMPVMDGLEMIREILLEAPQVQVLILSAHDDFTYAKQAIGLGATDYILKAELSAALLREKLSHVSARLEQAQEQTLTRLKAALYELFDSREERTRDALLCDISAQLSQLDASLLAAQLLPFLHKQLREKYHALHLPLPEPLDETVDAQTLCSWLRCAANTLYSLQAGETREYSPVVANALSFIHRSYQNNALKAEDIAAAVGLSKSRLATLFKAETGSTINDFITAVRIDNAKQLLATGQYKVYEVSELVGYKTSQYFSQIFFQSTGQYPNKYRAED